MAQSWRPRDYSGTPHETPHPPPDESCAGRGESHGVHVSHECACCGRPGARARRVTGGERLCTECRDSPTKKLLTLKMALNRTTLTEEDLEELVVGTVFNPVNPRFARRKLYFEEDVLALEAKHALEAARTAHPSSAWECHDSRAEDTR
jgi:hypothetical protein